MADWEEPLDSQTDPDAPITSQLGKRWDNNVIAVAEGAAGAPRVRIGALERLTAGDQIRCRDDASRSATGQLFSFSFLQAGAIRFSYYVKDVVICSVTRIRNGVETILYQNPLSANYSATVDIQVLPGDSVTLKYYAGGPGSVSNIRISTGGEDLWPGVGARLEGNTYNA